MNFSFFVSDPTLRSIAEELSSQLNFEVSSDGIPVSVQTCDNGFCVEKTADGLSVSYAEKSDFCRALGFLCPVFENGETVRQTAGFKTLCYMADVSRNAVLSMDGARRMIRYLASMGYNSMMLYAEDTFEIPDYPYFGHLRGRYTCEELRALDDYADLFGIELIPCIQTLAHLRSALRWRCFSEFTDTSDILLVGDERTYAFLESMLRTVASCFRSKRVHIGMDEAHDLGLGKYLDKNGYRNRFEILSGHLARVKQICDGLGLFPMIWSDMYFRLYNHGKYYMSEGMLPSEVTANVPKGVGLVYWDYYTEDAATLDNMFENHKIFGDLIFAGGAWKWSGYVPCNRISYRRCRIHAEACLRHGCKDVIVTGWADNGADASQFSILPSLLLYAELCYAPDVADDVVSDRFQTLFSIPMQAFMDLDLLDETNETKNVKITNPNKHLLYNGVFGGVMDAHVPEASSAHYLNAAKVLLSYADDPQFGYLFACSASQAFLLEKKAGLSVSLRRAYEEGKKDVLRWYAEKEIPEILSRVQDFTVLLRQQWYTENKTFGFDVQEIRLGGLQELLRSAAIRLKSYCNGEVDRIEELEQPILPYAVEEDGTPRKELCCNNWEYSFSVSKFY